MPRLSLVEEVEDSLEHTVKKGHRKSEIEDQFGLDLRSDEEAETRFIT